MALKILLNILTHGDELVGVRVKDEILKKYPKLIGDSVDVQIANERAYQEGKRYIDQDLNRVFPGKADGTYEEKRAFELVRVVSAYDVVIDIHSTKSGLEDTVIVTKLDPATKELLQKLSPRNVLFMNMKPDRALISCARIGIAFEMGKDTHSKTVIKTTEGVEFIFSYYGLISPVKPFGFQTEYYEVFESVAKPAGAHLEPHVQNFKQIKTGEIFARTSDKIEIRAVYDFYPVIFGSTNYESIFGFAARKMPGGLDSKK